MRQSDHPSHFIPDFSGKLGDKRLEARANLLGNRLCESPSSTIRRLAHDRAEQKAFYRLLGNGSFSESALVAESSSRMAGLCAGRHLLCVQDTCEINLSKQKGRVKEGSGLGASDRSETAHCFKLHPGLVLDTQGFDPLGFSHIKVFHRPEEGPDRFQRNYKRQPITGKESYKWIEVALESKRTLANAESVTFIEDREGDIYEQFAMVPDQRTHLLVRSRTTRNLANGESLYRFVDARPIAGTYTIELPADKRKDQFKREAKIALRFAQCEIVRPANLKRSEYPATMALTCISVKETGNARRPIDWKLLTDHKIENYQDALLMVQWYGARWYIEQLFRILKKQGFGIEEAQLESGWAIRKLVLMQMSAILKILQMNIAYSRPEGGQPIEELFDNQEIEVLEMMNAKLQGRTRKLQNHNDPKCTKWAAWVIGRLGGWKGYDSLGPPGVITIKRGLDRLSYLIEGVNLAKDVGTR